MAQSPPVLDTSRRHHGKRCRPDLRRAPRWYSTNRLIGRVTTEERVMADFGAIVTLFSRYAAANDWPDQELLESTFTEDATFELHIAGADSIGPFNGRQAIVDFFMPILNGQTDTRKHVISNYDVQGEARVNAYLTLIVTDNGETVLKSAGLYETEIVDGESGPRFRAMTLSLDSGF
jgi:hypothetical protein